MLFYEPVAADVFPNAEWIEGNGRWALVASCRGVVTVTLWVEFSRAMKSKMAIDRHGCGHRCDKRHRIIDLDPRQYGTHQCYREEKRDEKGFHSGPWL